MSEIVEESEPSQHRRRQNLFLEIPTRTLEEPTQDFVQIDMPPTPSPTPKRVNFSPLPSPGMAKFSEHAGPLSSKGKSSIKSYLPKLSFKYRNATSEIEKAAILALESSSDKPRISRTTSLTKFFTPRLKNTSSLPGTPVAHSNPESMHGGNTVDMLTSDVSIFSSFWIDEMHLYVVLVLWHL